MVIPVLVALDVASLEQAETLARRLLGRVAGFKVGLELLMGHGPQAVGRVASLGSPVFADAKLHDIPNTVEAAARQLAKAGARWVTVHGAGGRETVTAAVAGLSEASDGRAGALVVTALTSLDDRDLAEVGMAGTVSEQVKRMALLAAKAEAEGVICAPKEAVMVKAVAPELLVVTPGIRLRGADTHDQKRVSTPAEALRAGADLLVMGRAITGAADPVAAVGELESDLGLSGLL